MKKLSVFENALYWAIAPAIVLLIVNAVYIENTRPRGPFCCGEQRMVLLNNALNFFLAEVFQVILAIFLFTIGCILISAFRLPSGDARSRWLGACLAGIYVLSSICALLLARGWPSFDALMLLGLAIIALSWTALIWAIRVRGRAIIANIPPMTSNTTAPLPLHSTE